MLNATYKSGCNYAQCHYAECHYAEFHSAECHYAECHGMVKNPCGLQDVYLKVFITMSCQQELSTF